MRSLTEIATGITQVMGAVLDGVVSAMVDDKEFKDELFDMRAMPSGPTSIALPL